MDRLEQLESRVADLARLVNDLRRDLGPLKYVTTVDEFRKHWPALSKTYEGRINICNWWWRFALHKDPELRLSRSDADKILEAIEKLESV